MKVNKKRLAEIFGVDVRTIQRWQDQGMPVIGGGGKGNEVLYSAADAIKWYAERDATLENEKLRQEVEEMRKAGESDLQPGTLDYERYRLIRAQADAQELTNLVKESEVIEVDFCTFLLSRVSGEMAAIFDTIPLSMQRRFPELDKRHIEFLKVHIAKVRNKASGIGEIAEGLMNEYIENKDR